MPIIINGNNLTVGTRQVVNENPIDKITFNGVTVWEYDTTGHSALNTTVVQRTDYSTDYHWDYAHRETQRRNVDNFYVTQYVSSQCSGNGQYVQAKATYKGKINVDALPDWQFIKRIVINRYGYGSQTFILDGTQTTLNFTDYDESHTDAHEVGSYASVTAQAGISSLTYYYV